MEEKEYVYKQINDIYISGERLTDLVKEFQMCIDKYGPSIRLEYRCDNYGGYDTVRFYFEYKVLETDEEYQQRLLSKEVAMKAVEQRERELLKNLMEKYIK
jgi:hypothetical protein